MIRQLIWGIIVFCVLSGCRDPKVTTYLISPGVYRYSGDTTLVIGENFSCTLRTGTTMHPLNLAGRDFDDQCYTNIGPTCRYEYFILADSQIIMGKDTIPDPVLYAYHFTDVSIETSGVTLGTFDPTNIIRTDKQFEFIKQ